MSSHTLALLVIACFVFQVGIAFAYPKDTRPWTPARKVGYFVGVAQAVFMTWILVTIL